MRLRDSVFLITGGGSGLGAAVAEMFVKAGAKVMIADMNKQAGELAANELGTGVCFVETDVTSESDAQRAVEYTVETFGGIDGLVNCAGISPVELIVGKNGPHRLESFQRVLDINFSGTFNMIRLAANAMTMFEPNEDGERGVIVIVGSVTAFDGQVGQVAYAGSKSGVIGMTLPLARELARFGIRVMAVAPGIFETPMFSSAPEKLKEALCDDVPFPPRAGKSPEFASLVAHIVTNTYLNGEVIRLDGALRLPFRR